MPLIIKNSSALSSMAESDPSLFTTGSTRAKSPPKASVCIVSSRASILLTLPRMVLISPLWAMSRLGWARCQLGSVLVEKRECTMASDDSYSGARKSSKKVRSCPTRNIPLYTMVRLDSEQT